MASRGRNKNRTKERKAAQRVKRVAAEKLRRGLRRQQQLSAAQLELLIRAMG